VVRNVPHLSHKAVHLLALLMVYTYLRLNHNNNIMLEIVLERVGGTLSTHISRFYSVSLALLLSGLAYLSTEVWLMDLGTGGLSCEHSKLPIKLAICTVYSFK